MASNNLNEAVHGIIDDIEYCGNRLTDIGLLDAGSQVMMRKTAERHVCFRLATCGTADHFAKLIVENVSESEGILETVDFPFDEIFEHKPSSGSGWYIWRYRGESSWYEVPPKRDLDILRKQVAGYLELI